MYSDNMWDIGFWAAMAPLFIVILVLVIYWTPRAYDFLKKRIRRKGVNINTGSWGDYDPLEHMLKDRPLGGIYLLEKGQAVPFLTASPHDGEDDELLQAQTAVRFLMYAMDRDDWKYEFSEWESTLEDRLRARTESLRRERLMLSLRVIHGGKKEEDDE